MAMTGPGTLDAALMALVQAIAADDTATALRLLDVSPALASARFNEGATRQTAKEHYLDEIERYIYAGDTALHMAAAAYRTEIVQKLIAMGADVRARNRRGAEPLHLAAAGVPSSRMWNPHPLESMTTRGASGLMLERHWQMMGALEAADGMLLSGISTAYIFAVMQVYWPMLSDLLMTRRHPR
jgi:hypothetical protein